MPERERVDRVVARINAGLDGLRLETIRWEHRYYRADSTFQAQITSSAACEIVISIFWQRLGTPLPPDFERMPDGRTYPSGTVYEVMKAIEARAASKTGLPDVLVYRKLADATVPVGGREEYRLAHEQRELFLAFWEEWFVTREGQFRAAYNAFRTTDEFDAALESHIRAWLVDHGFFSRSVTWPLAERGSPFRGLEAFGPHDEEVFFGREQDVRRALARLASAQAGGGAFLLVIGESGSGKSSLVRAGLVPRLRRGGLGSSIALWRTAEMRPGTDPFRALAEALFAGEALPELRDGDFGQPSSLASQLAIASLVAAAPVLRGLARAGDVERARLQADETTRIGLVLVVDQLEEVLSDPGRHAQADAFAGLLAALVAGGPVVVVATMRADTYPAMAALPNLLHLKETGAVLDVGPPDDAALADIVRKPAEAAGLAFGAGEGGDTLDAILLADAAGSRALPLIEFVLTQLYERLLVRLSRKGLTLAAAPQEDLVLTADDYHALGGLQGALAGVAEDTLARLPEASRSALRPLLRRLVGTGDERRGIRFALREADLDYLAGDHANGSLVDSLVPARILVTGTTTEGRRRCRLAHESVLAAWPRAATILAEDERFLRIRSDLEVAEARWARHARDAQGRGAEAFLLAPGVPLAEAEEARKLDPDALGPRLKAFADRSTARARRGQRRTMIAAGIFALTAVVAAGAATWALHAQQLASRNAALAARNAAEASRNRDEAVTRLHRMADQTDAFVVNIIQDMRKRPGITVEAVEALLEQSNRQVDELLAIDPDDAYIRFIAAGAKGLLAENDLELGRIKEAEAAAWRCFELASSVPQSDRNLSWGKTTAHCIRALALVAKAEGKDTDALRYAGQAKQIWQALSEADPDDTVLAHNAIATTLLEADVLARMGRLDEAAARYGQADAAIARRSAARPDDEPVLDELRLVTYDIAGLEMARGHIPEAAASARRAVDASRRLLTREPLSAYRLVVLAVSLARLAEVTSRLPDPADMLAASEEAVGLRRRVALLDPAHVQARSALVEALNVYAIALSRSGRTEDFARIVQEGAREAREVVRLAGTPSLANRRDLSIALNKLSTVELAAGHRDEALAVALESLDIASDLRRNAPSPQAAIDVAAALVAVAEAGDAPDERRREAVAIYEDLSGKGLLPAALEPLLVSLRATLPAQRQAPAP